MDLGRFLQTRVGKLLLTTFFYRLPVSLQESMRGRVQSRESKKDIRQSRKKLKKTDTPLVQKKISETSKVRDSLSKFCIGDGVDIGYGGDPIVPWAICMDLENKYADYEGRPQHLHGNAEDMVWFRDESLDWVYSSHVLEDFEEPELVFLEWWRIVRKEGKLILFLPDEQKYRAHCMNSGKTPNPHHIHENFGPQFVLSFLETRSDWALEHFVQESGIYSFEMVIRKVA